MGTQCSSQPAIDVQVKSNAEGSPVVFIETSREVIDVSRSQTTTQEIEAFRIAVSRPAVAELRARLRATRWPNGVADRTGGFPVTEARRLVSHWAESFDWYEQEERLNALPQYLVNVGDQQIHVVHFRSADTTNVPLLLLHGWPGSFVEMLGLAERLAAAHDVVIPSIPGFAFSSAAAEPGFSNRRCAGVMAALMTALGYERFGVHGGDIGAGIATWMAVLHPGRVVGLHLNFIPGSYAPAQDAPPSAVEQSFLDRRARWSDESGGYAHVQRTRPLTLAYGLADSPVGLMAWIGEKFAECCDPTSARSDDTLLTNVSIYWFTNTIASSVRMYLESRYTPLKFELGARLTTPTAIAHFPFELPLPPRSWVERVYPVVRWTQMSKGGHFAALEQPDALSADVGDFFARLGGGAA
jgi:pimeloyl-ACP methyl ester carboxylesterase